MKFVFRSSVDIQYWDFSRGLRDFFLLPQWFESFPSEIPRVRWRNLVRVDDWANDILFFFSAGIDATLGIMFGIWEHLGSFKKMECLQGYFKTLWIGI